MQQSLTFNQMRDTLSVYLRYMHYVSVKPCPGTEIDVHYETPSRHFFAEIRQWGREPRQECSDVFEVLLAYLLDTFPGMYETLEGYVAKKSLTIK